MQDKQFSTLTLVVAVKIAIKIIDILNKHFGDHILKTPLLILENFSIETNFGYRILIKTWVNRNSLHL